MTNEHELGPRLIDGGTGEAWQRRAATLIARLPPPRGLSARTRAEIASGLVARARPSSLRRWWAVALVGVTSAAVAGTVVHVRRSEPTPQPRGVVAPVIVARPSVDPVPIEQPPAVETPAPVMAPEVRKPRRPAPPRAHEPTGPSALAEESRLLEQALARLRAERDATGALAALDEYTRRFGRGTLALEADRARVEALLALDRNEAALRLLEGMALGAAARDVSLRLTRGELRAVQGRCREAEADLAAVLAAAAGEAVERALYHRGVCRLRAGEVERGRADLDEYVRRFPRGRFAAKARQALGTDAR